MGKMHKSRIEALGRYVCRNFDANTWVLDNGPHRIAVTDESVARNGKSWLRKKMIRFLRYSRRMMRQNGEL